jgi:hypothetical protein
MSRIKSDALPNAGELKRQLAPRVVACEAPQIYRRLPTMFWRLFPGPALGPDSLGFVLKIGRDDWIRTHLR